MTNNSGSAVPPMPGARSSLMRQRIRMMILLFLLGGVFFVWWSQPPRVRARPQPHFTQFLPPIRTEEQWVVGEIVNQIGEMVAFGTTRRSPTQAGLQSEVILDAQAKQYVVEMRLGELAPPVQTRFGITDHL